MSAVKKEATFGGEAAWIVALKQRVASFIGRTVTGIKEVEREDGGMRVSGTTMSDAGVPFSFSVCGPFDVEVADPSGLPPSDVSLYPFGSEFGPQVPAAVEYGDANSLWETAGASVPLLVSPRLGGIPAVIEKKGGKASMWYAGDRGTDQLSKFTVLKDYVLKMAQDFVAEATVGVEKDGMPIFDDAMSQQLAAKNPDLAGGMPTISLTDLLFLNEELHAQDAAARRAALEPFFRDSLSVQPSFRMAPVQEARDQAQLQTAVDWARAFPGSGGAVAKTAGAPYTLSGSSKDVAHVAKQDPPPQMGIYKANDEERTVYCVVLRPNFVDSQDDVMSPVEVQKAQRYYAENSDGTLKLRHGKDEKQGDAAIDAVVLENYIAPADFKLGRGMVLKGDWVMGIRVDDPKIWAGIKSGEYTGFSVGGVGTRQPIA